MDGNGRWATRRGLPRAAGHRKGVEALRATVREVGRQRIPYLTLFAFSSENWSRPAQEVRELLGLMKRFIRRDLAELHRENVRVRVIGDRTTLSSDILDLLVKAETVTRDNTGLTLVVAFNYGARDELTRAMRAIAARVERGEIAVDSIGEETIDGALDTAGLPCPDLIVRTSGEMRLSNFLLWQAAYTEFVFAPCAWPDFDAEELAACLRAYASRDRRFGGVAEPRSLAS